MPPSVPLLQVVRFVVVGGGVTAVFMGLNWWFGKRLSSQRAFFCAYPPAVALHFLLNKLWTFGEPATFAASQLLGYAVMTGVAFLIQWAVFRLLTRHTKIKPWLASGAATVAQMVLAFAAMKLWVFARVS